MQKLRAPVTGRHVPICSLYHTHSFSVHLPSGAGSKGLCSFTQPTTAAAARGTSTSTAAVSQRNSYSDAGVSHNVPPAAAYGQASMAWMSFLQQKQQQRWRQRICRHKQQPLLRCRPVAAVFATSHAQSSQSCDVHLQVISAEANFVRVNISHLETDSATSSSTSSNGTSTSSNGTSSGSSSSSSAPADATHPTPPVKQLLCTVRALLKKIGQRVLVGDHVRVNPIDWTDGRGVVESIQPRSSELADPAVANVDHVLLLFGLTQPPVSVQQGQTF